MALEIITVGAKVKYAFETVSGQRPTSGYKLLGDVTDAPEISLSLSTIDVSNTTDKITRYVEGRQDPGGEKSFTLNHTDKAINLWETLAAEAEVKKGQGLRLWFEYSYPNAQKSFFWCGTPKKLGNSGFSGNSASTLTASAVFNEYVGWEAKSASLATADTAKSVAAGGNVTVNVTNAAGTLKVKTSDSTKATAEATGSSVKITGVAEGVTIITVTDENLDEASIVVTVTGA